LGPLTLDTRTLGTQTQVFEPLCLAPTYLATTLPDLLVSVGTCSPGQDDPTGGGGGGERNANRVSARDGDCSINPASQGHCTGVFIGG
jgi:hypothetical protein